MFCGCSWFVARHEFPTYFHRVFFSLWEEKFKDTKGVTRSRKSKKNRQCNERNKKGHNVKKGIRNMVVNATFNNQRPATSHWKTCSHNVVSSTPCHKRDLNSQPQWWLTLIVWVVVNPITIWSRPRRPEMSQNYLQNIYRKLKIEQHKLH